MPGTKFGFAAAAILASTLGFASLAKNIALPLGDRDNPARVKEVEYMRRLDAFGHRLAAPSRGARHRLRG